MIRTLAPVVFAVAVGFVVGGVVLLGAVGALALVLEVGGVGAVYLGAALVILALSVGR